MMRCVDFLNYTFIIDMADMAICARDKRDRNEITGNIFHITFHCFIKSKYEESKEGIKGRVEIVLFVCNLCVKFF